MPLSPSDSTIDRSLLVVLGRDAATPAAIERDVLALFDEWASPLLRYVASFGLSPDETEDVVQDVFLALFRHLCLGRSRSNLRGWLFQVAHNQALKQRRRTRVGQARRTWDETVLARQADPSLNPEQRLSLVQRQQHVRSILRALPERDRRCVHLRAEGLPYREIAATLGISLGAVAKALTRSITRIVNGDRR